MKAMILLLILILPMVAKAQSDFWQQTNGPTLGDIYSLIATSSDRIFAGFDGGIAYSTDSGISWKRIKSVLDSCRVTVFATKNDTLIFAGTWGQGIFKSTDGGFNWYHVGGNFNSDYINGLILTSTGNIIASGWSGLHLTLNDGITWTNIFSQRTNTVAADSFGRIFVATDIIPEYFGEYGGVYRSCNNGISWERINMGLPSSYFYPNVLLSGRDSSVFVGTEGRLFRSTNGGKTWLPTGINNISALGLMKNGRLFAGDGWVGALYRSNDNGLNWYNNGIGIRNFKIYSFTENSVGDYFVGTNGGIYKTTNSGDNWHTVNSGYTYISTTAIAIHPNSSIWAVAGFYNVGSGIFVSTDNGVNWTEKSHGLPDSHFGPIAIDSGGAIYLGTSEGVFVTTDLGENWDMRNPGVGLYIYEIFAAHQNDVYLSAGGMNSTDSKFVYRTTDQGRQWTKASGGLPPSSYAISFAVDSNDNIYGSFWRHGVYRSINRGESWKPVNNGFLDTLSVGPIAINSTNHLFASDWPYGVFRSSDGGNSWVHQDNTGLTEPSITTLLVDSRNNLYAGLWNLGGVFFSPNYGTSWSSINTGLGQLTVWSLCSDKLGYLLAGTYGNGVFRSISPTVSVHNENKGIASAFFLDQNYPNPFNPNTVISFSVPHKTFVSLQIFNTIGQIVATLVSENLDAGSYSIAWNAHNLVSGLYFYRFQASGFVKTKKMMLIR